MEPSVLHDLALRPLLFTALAALAFMPLEALLPEHEGEQRRARTRAAWTIDLAFATIGQVITRIGLVFVAGFALERVDAVALDQPLFAFVSDSSLRFALELVAGLLLFELAGYGYHRLAHRVPALWHMHRVHHGSESMDWLAAFRQHPLEIVLMTLAQNAPLVLLGVPLGAHATLLLLLKLNTVFVHANLRVPPGPWSRLLATPRFHHRHHQRTGEPRNFASLLPIFDRMFGTYSGETSREFGLAPEP